MQLVLVGAGPVGRAAARAAVEDGIADKVIAVVDPDPTARTAACDQFGVAGLSSVGDLNPGEPGDAAIVAISSRAEETAAEIVRLVSLGYHVVTTCEELADPGRHVRRGIEASAHSDGRVVIATGANPGFVMDRLAVVTAQAARNVRSITVRRIVDTSDRREPLVEKTGRGLTAAEFAAGVADRSLGHVGMIESARLLAAGLDWIVQGVKEHIEPVLTDDRVEGIHHIVRLQTRDDRSIVLDLMMRWEAEDPHDEITIDGEPPIRLRLDGGYHGDLGTTASVVRALILLPRLDPGFYRPTDLPIRPPK